jgi:protease I
MKKISGKKILIVATHGFEQSELEVPRNRLMEAGATVHIASPNKGDIRGWEKHDWGKRVKVDRNLDEVHAEDYDAIVLPGGQINPDVLRVNQKAIRLVRAFYDQKKVVAAVCHGPWLLIEAGIIKGRKATSHKSIRTDMLNAGARWEDSTVVNDEGLITSRNPADLNAFVEKITEEIAEGHHFHRSAA